MWIEIADPGLKIDAVIVTPLAGVWIEIDLGVDPITEVVSHPPRGGVDRNPDIKVSTSR